MLKASTITFAGHEWEVQYDYEPAINNSHTRTGEDLGEPDEPATVSLESVCVPGMRRNLLQFFDESVVRNLEARILQSYSTPGSIV